jgi:hypothetical protein
VGHGPARRGGLWRRRPRRARARAEHRRAVRHRRGCHLRRDLARRPARRRGLARLCGPDLGRREREARREAHRAQGQRVLGRVHSGREGIGVGQFGQDAQVLGHPRDRTGGGRWAGDAEGREGRESGVHNELPRSQSALVDDFYMCSFRRLLQDYVLSVAVSADGQWVVSGSKDRGVQFWDARTATVQLMLQGHKNSVISIDLNPVGGVLASGSGDWQARICAYSVLLIFVVTET